jgi:hypothetical protein
MDGRRTCEADARIVDERPARIARSRDPLRRIMDAGARLLLAKPVAPIGA